MVGFEPNAYEVEKSVRLENFCSLLIWLSLWQFFRLSLLVVESEIHLHRLLQFSDQTHASDAV